MNPIRDLWRSSSALVWTAALDAAGRFADDQEPSTSPGTPAAVWASAKATAHLAVAPAAFPALAYTALNSAQRVGGFIDAFPDHLLAISNGAAPVLPGPRTTSLPASERYLITSDLHRCIAGRLDWPGRQGVKDLYAQVLGEYAGDGWHLIENGDVEDFWMVGGSTWGAVYDAAYLTGALVGPRRLEARRHLLGQHLHRIVANNTAIYRTLSEGFVSQGRYHRTMGNHDDVYADESMVDRLGVHLPGTEVSDTILLRDRNGKGDKPSIADVQAVVAHGHLTDSWNGHDTAVLGRYITWLATSLDDLPGSDRRNGLPDESALDQLLGGGASNRLIALDPRFGGNRRFDSLDEVRLFERLEQRTPDCGWPWLVHGHTHFPMLSPVDSRGRPARYANSGCGVLREGFTALEWDQSNASGPLRLVVWHRDGGRARRTELVPDGDSLLPV